MLLNMDSKLLLLSLNIYVVPTRKFLRSTTDLTTVKEENFVFTHFE